MNTSKPGWLLIALLALGCGDSDDSLPRGGGSGGDAGAIGGGGTAESGDGAGGVSG